ncbi:MAG TPA: transglutaminase, partial [Geomonas sp.]|nr:transglutaminase [Geomonas sp.]
MKRLLFFMLAFTMCLAPAAWAASRAGVVTVEVDLSKQESGKQTKLWIPYAVSDKYQSITDVKVSGDYASSAVYTDPVSGTPILFANWEQNATSRKLTYSFAVVRDEIHMSNLPATEPAWNPADYAEYLEPTTLGPT